MEAKLTMKLSQASMKKVKETRKELLKLWKIQLLKNNKRPNNLKINLQTKRILKFVDSSTKTLIKMVKVYGSFSWKIIKIFSKHKTWSKQLIKRKLLIFDISMGSILNIAEISIACKAMKLERNYRYSLRKLK